LLTAPESQPPAAASVAAAVDSAPDVAGSPCAAPGPALVLIRQLVQLPSCLQVQLLQHQALALSAAALCAATAPDMMPVALVQLHQLRGSWVAAAFGLKFSAVAAASETTGLPVPTGAGTAAAAAAAGAWIGHAANAVLARSACRSSKQHW